jgi:hypothetical protein
VKLFGISPLNFERIFIASAEIFTWHNKSKYLYLICCFSVTRSGA